MNSRNLSDMVVRVRLRLRAARLCWHLIMSQAKVPTAGVDTSGQNFDGIRLELCVSGGMSRFFFPPSTPLTLNR